MLNKIFRTNLPAIISGLLVFIAVGEINFVLAWVCFVPLFISLFNKTPKQVFRLGFIFGFTLSCFAFSWMVSGAERFTGFNFLYGLGVFLLCAFLLSFYWGALLWIWSILKKRSTTNAVYVEALLVASVFCVGEYLFMLLTTGFPWFAFHSANALAGNLYAVQPASFFGMHIMSFVVVLVNYLISFFALQKQWTKMFIPVAVVLLYTCIGYFILQSFERTAPGTKAFNVAILAENIPPDIKRDDANGNMLVQRLLDLNKAAVAQKPDLILWSESAIPWTYRKDDDLVNEVLKESAASNTTHILGINTEVENNIVNNSAYCISPGGNVAGRYDKQYLLSLIEKPLSGMSIPFFSSKGFFVNKDEEHSSPLNTPYAKAGIMICNESAMPSAASDMAKKGAEFFCNMSNDGWFNNTYVVRDHFYNARLRAVETRKDVVVNCNNGYSGLIQASGNIAEQEKNTEPFVKIANVHPNNYETLATESPALFLYVCATFIIWMTLIKLFRK
jgi:apolipoprotein N-acyltransferase